MLENNKLFICSIVKLLNFYIEIDNYINIKKCVYYMCMYMPARLRSCVRECARVCLLKCESDVCVCLCRCMCVYVSITSLREKWSDYCAFLHEHCLDTCFIHSQTFFNI